MDPFTALRAIIRMARPTAGPRAYGEDNAGAMASEEAAALRGWLKMRGYSPRVEIHPATDAWMMGDRYGVVIGLGRKYVHVRMDRSGRVLKLHPANLYDAI